MGSVYSQDEFDIRCEWGSHGIAQLGSGSDAIVIVDVLSFCTCVDIAVGNGASVYPWRWKDGTAAAYAESTDAILASAARTLAGGYSLAPASLLKLPAGARLVLPSPNGATLSLATGRTPTYAGCLRNAAAIAAGVQKEGRRISVIMAGEKWEDGFLRPAIEDLIGAGAVIRHLPGSRSPEAEAAVAAFEHARQDLPSCLKRCSSGNELIARGFERDVELAAALDVSRAIPVLIDRAYTQQPVSTP